MSDEFDTLVVGVRADRRAFAADVQAMRAELEGPLAAGAERAGRAIETALLGAVRTGKFGFEDLKRVILSTMAEIARSSISAGLGSIGLGSSGLGGGSGATGGGLLSLANSLLGSVLGLPGRATGGPVSPGAAYLVGERGPELFVPTSSGRIETSNSRARDVRITVNVGGNGASDPQRMAASGRQIAAAVRRAIEAAED